MGITDLVDIHVVIYADLPTHKKVDMDFVMVVAIMDGTKEQGDEEV